MGGVLPTVLAGAVGVLPEVVVVALGAGRNALEKCFGPIGSMFMRLARPERFCSDRNELISSWLVMYNPKGHLHN